MKLLQIESDPTTSSGSAKAWLTSCSVFCDFGFGREVVNGGQAGPLVSYSWEHKNAREAMAE